MAITDGQTIVALASGAGRTAIAVLRISGPATSAIVRAVAGKLPDPRQAVVRAIRNDDGDILDRALLLYFAAPASFTGEDVAEFHLHGGPAVVTAVLRCLLATGLCRLAEPGEFSRRAFLNGKLDLTQAEGIADLIDAETEAQRKQAMRQLDGVLAEAVERWREDLLHAMALIEASLDFSDEGDVPEGLAEKVVHASSRVQLEIRSALRNANHGERLRDGFTVVIAGPPNAGKSTLLNRISGRDVAIVSPIPGTTRDAIEVRCDLHGLPVVFVDTAGLRESQDPIEQQGIARARKRVEAADLVLYLHASNDDEPAHKIEFSAYGSAACLHVLSKADLGVSSQLEGTWIISALTGDGIEQLLDEVGTRLQAAYGAQDALITRERHRHVLEQVVAHLDRIAQARAETPSELIAEDLRLAARTLGRITGRVDIEDVLDRLFAGFCIGK